MLKIIAVFLFISLAASQMEPNKHFETRTDPPIVGGQSEVQDFSSISDLLTKNMHLLSEGEGAGLTFVGIENATSQVVAGALHRVVAIFKDSKGDQFRCNIEIYERKWEDFIEIKIKSKEKVETTTTTGF